MYEKFNFNVIKKLKNARLSLLTTPHGTIETPAFIFCATKAAIKGALDPQDMLNANTQIILSNTYHLMLSPGADLVKDRGGLHNFMGWKGPILTDSGGFQIFSLGNGGVVAEIKGSKLSQQNKTLLKINEEGATFKSYLDGSLQTLTPELSIQIQNKLGSDIILVLDECTPFNVSKGYTEASMKRSHRWELRSLREFERLYDGKQALYGIIQGGIYEDLRAISADFVNSNNFFGIAIGGSLGNTKEQMYKIVNYTSSLLDKSKPVHLLGIGGIKDIFNGVKAGIDTFDCVHPTRLARHAGAIIRGKEESINLRNRQYKNDDLPLDENCKCYSCLNFSKSYINYLLKARELLSIRLLTIHNVYTMNRLMEEIREGIKKDNLDEVEKNWIKSL